jgi:hypothetical protein
LIIHKKIQAINYYSQLEKTVQAFNGYFVWIYLFVCVALIIIFSKLFSLFCRYSEPTPPPSRPERQRNNYNNEPVNNIPPQRIRDIGSNAEQPRKPLLLLTNGEHNAGLPQILVTSPPTTPRIVTASENSTAPSPTIPNTPVENPDRKVLSILIQQDRPLPTLITRNITVDYAETLQYQEQLRKFLLFGLFLLLLT